MIQAALLHIYLKNKQFQGFGFRDFTDFLSVTFLNKLGGKRLDRCFLLLHLWLVTNMHRYYKLCRNR